MFGEGDTVWVYWGQENGWWYGSAGGRQGWFPESYVEVSASFLSAQGMKMLTKFKPGLN